MTFLTFEEFLECRKQGTDFSLKPVGVSPAADLTPEIVETQPVAITEPAGELSPDPAPETKPEPAIPQPMMIDIAPELLLPPIDLNGDAGVNLA
jgi:hypothetical protein